MTDSLVHIQSASDGPSFVVQFVSVRDIPTPSAPTPFNAFIRYAVITHHSTFSDYLAIFCSNCILLRSYIAIEVTKRNDPKCSYKCISDVVQTNRRLHCGSDCVFNSYRDFRMSPPEGSYICIELYNWLDGSDVYNSGKSNCELIGSVTMPVKLLKENENLLTSDLLCHKYGNYRKNPNFSVTLKRCYLDKEPPICKTVFLIRHGESTWNKAQEQVNVPGLIAYDHPLTRRGIDQAIELNSRWQQFADEYTTMIHTVDPHEGSNEASGNSDDVTYSQTPLKQQGVSVIQVAEQIFADENYPLDFIPKDTNHDDYDDGEINDLYGVVPDKLNDSQAIIKECFESDDASCSDGDDEPTSDTQSNDFVGFISHSIRKSLKSSRDSLTSTRVSSLRQPEEGYKSFSQMMAMSYNGPSTRSIKQRSLRGSLTDLFRSGSGKSVPSPISSPRMPARNRKNRRHYLRRLFIKSSTIYASPLTRAIQTAIIALEHHPAGKSNGITLYSPMREFKTRGGLDTVGVACGETAIRSRIVEELTKHISHERARELMGSHYMNAADVVHPWWTPVSSYDDKQDKEERMREFANFIRYCDEASPIFVGHSLFFKTFCNRRISTYLARNRPALVANMRRYKLGNAVLMAITLVFTNSNTGNGCCDGKIVDADLICGGGFEGGDNFDGDERDDVTRIDSTRDVSACAASPNNDLIGIDVNKPEEIAIASPESEGKKKSGLVSKLFSGMFHK